MDYLLLRDRLLREEKQLATEAGHDAEIAALIPFQQTIIGFEEARRRMETVDPQKCAAALAKMSAGHRGRAELRRRHSKANPGGAESRCRAAQPFALLAAGLVQLL